MTRHYEKKHRTETVHHRRYLAALEKEIQTLVEEISNMLEAQAELENRPELVEQIDLWPELVQKKKPAIPPILAEFEYQIQLIRTAQRRHHTD